MSCERYGFEVLPSLTVTSNVKILKAVYNVRFQVHTAVLLEIQVIWYIEQVENMAYELS
jgi:hypothetical protein